MATRDVKALELRLARDRDASVASLDGTPLTVHVTCTPGNESSRCSVRFAIDVGDPGHVEAGTCRLEMN